MSVQAQKSEQSVRVSRVVLLALGLTACGGNGATPAAPAAGASGATPNAQAGAMGAIQAGAGEGAPRAGVSGGVSGMTAPPAAGRDAAGGTGTAGPQVAGGAAVTASAGSSAGATAGSAAGAEPMQPTAAGIKCPPRAITPGEARLHMHHIHFNTQDPEAQIALVQKFFNAKPIDFCKDEASPRTTRAAKTERAFFLYTKLDKPPSNMRLNRLAHVGYNHPDVTGELKRMLAMDVPLADASACATAAMGTPCNTFTVLWFYIDTPDSARFEVATGPGPSTMGFSHIHLVAPTYAFYRSVLGEALQDAAGSPHVDGVNMVDSGRTGMLDPSVMYQDTRGAAVDHVGFSTTDLDAALARIKAAGIEIAEPISVKPELGFRSFMVRSPEGVWLEILEDMPFVP